MRHTLFHNHCGNLESVLLLRDLLNEIDLIKRPLFFVDGDLSIKFYLEGMKLSYFQEIILLGVAPLDADAEPILFGKIVNFHDQQGEHQYSFPDLL
jgi:hypothetical protein